MRFDGLPKLEDLREMSEEQFVEAFEILRARTRDWSEFPPELITEDSRQLFVLRCALGLTQKEFARIRGVRKSHIGRIESGRKKIIHLRPAQRWATKVDGILKERKPSLEIAKVKFVDYKRFIGALQSPKIIRPVPEVTEKELLDLFIRTKEFTKSFTTFSPIDLMEHSRTMLIFRLVKGLSQRQFAFSLGVHPRSLSSIERGRDIIGMDLAIKLVGRLKELLQEYKLDIDFETILHRFKIFTTDSKFDIGKAIKRGLDFAKKQKLSKIEEKIKNVLKSHDISFGVHPIIEGLKRKLCVDFAIPSEESPKFIIEAFSASSRRPLGHVLRKVWETDHRFHMVKLREPDITTVICVDWEKGVPIQRIRERIELDIFSTDILLIKEEIQKLPEILRDYTLNKIQLGK